MEKEQEMKNIYQRINNVMKSVKYVKKDKEVGFGAGKYKAVTRDSVVALVRELVVEHGIVIETSQLSGEWTFLRDMNAQPEPVKMGLYSGYYEVRFINIDSPQDRATICIEAHANDNGDKAPGKAATYAEKTAILKQFLLETGLDDEERHGQSTVSDDMSDRFKFLVESQDHMGLFEFMQDIGTDEAARNELYNSFEYGKKTEMKKLYSELLSRANQDFDDWASDLDGHIANEDDNGIEEGWTDLTKPQKLKVWARLKDESKEFLKNRKGE